ncbi:MAG TPA: AbrB/MazE/SpoVT family DNA-binding domain-containing protein [Acidimicrobiia bacterium]|nr:AbrB/MazE/SpoVT family DNA-binding domain-containing protein [Acidimicrobiia bacterium]
MEHRLGDAAALISVFSAACLGGDSTLESGIARKIDDLGRIVIPAETRRLFNIREGDQILISIEGTGIVLRKLETTCVFCGRTEEVSPFKGKGICGQCRLELP